MTLSSFWFLGMTQFWPTQRLQVDKGGIMVREGATSCRGFSLLKFNMEPGPGIYYIKFWSENKLQNHFSSKTLAVFEISRVPQKSQEGLYTIHPWFFTILPGFPRISAQVKAPPRLRRAIACRRAPWWNSWHWREIGCTTNWGAEGEKWGMGKIGLLWVMMGYSGTYDGL